MLAISIGKNGVRCLQFVQVNMEMCLQFLLVNKGERRLQYMLVIIRERWLPLTWERDVIICVGEPKGEILVVLACEPRGDMSAAFAGKLVEMSAVRAEDMFTFYLVSLGRDFLQFVLVKLRETFLVFIVILRGHVYTSYW